MIAARPLEAGLHLVATPIGNLGDITVRALETLAAADVIACEDTRVSRVLLDRYGIRTPLTAYHEHNAARAEPKLGRTLAEGKAVALISDAGTPLISDPGHRLVAAALLAGHRVIPVPGASAVLAALIASGLPNDSFFFAGFLPSRDKARRDRLAELAAVPATLILYESPNRVAATLVSAAEVLGGARPAAVCRELTKLHEEISRGRLDDLAAAHAAAGRVRGEIVLVIGPAAEDGAAAPSDDDLEAMLLGLLARMPPAKAAGEAARLTGLARRALYRRLLAMKDDAEGR